MKFVLVPKTIGRMVCFATIIWLSVASSGSAQGFHQLTSDDFRGSIGNISMGVIAYTNCTIDFK